METRNSKLIISNAGGTASNGAKTYKISLPNAWIKELGFDEHNRNVELVFDGEKIIISPKRNLPDLIAYGKNNELIILEYFNYNNLCTKIAVDYTTKEIAIENYSDNPIETAFGINQMPTWEDYENFLLERCIPEERDGLKEYLTSIGVDEFDPLEIIKKTQGKMAEDNQWIEVKECL